MIVRSKINLVHDALENKKGIISPEIQSIERNLKTGNYVITVYDRLRVNTENTAPGEPLYAYQFLRKRTKSYPVAQISSLFDLFGETIVKGEGDFDQKFVATMPEALLFISNTTSIYGSTAKTQGQILAGEAGDFELVDETLEVVPEPEV